MAEFCKCGSLMMNGRCTNKSCAFDAQNSSGVTGLPSKRARTGAKKPTGTGTKSPAKAANPRRASKVITYNLYETDSEDKQDQAE